MTTESEHSRYRSGYAAGQRDAVDSSQDDDMLKRSLTGDDWADTGYAHGFAEEKERLRTQAFSDLWRLVRDILRIPQLTGWGKRVAGRVRGTA